MSVHCYTHLITCALEDSGTLVSMVFRRIDEVASGPVHDLFNERDPANKVYHKFPVRGQVDYNPKHNVTGAGGGEELTDVKVSFYGQTYNPEYHDLLDLRGTTYDVIGIEPIHPHGENEQLGWVVGARRFA